MPIPRSTYRVQLHAGFTFDDAAAIAPYLAELGVTHFYASPYLQAAPGSTHGYDVVDHHRVNVELGGEDGHRRLGDALGAAGLGQVLDIVPNHMAIGVRENAWWWDVLENGPSSIYASYFDVDWDPPESKLRNVVLLPVLGDHYGRILEAGELRLTREGGSFTISYYDNVFPVAPRSLDDLLRTAAARCESDLLESIAAMMGRLPHATSTDRDSVYERHRDKEVLRAAIARVCDEVPEVAKAVDDVVAETNADPDALDGLLERQNYRMAFWRTAGRELDYRRFFDINTLVGLRMEDELVFADTHGRVVHWLRDGALDGVRIDHPDGLRDPQAYLERLQGASDEAWVVVEKILEHGEELPSSWPTAGTTGYDFATRATGVLVDPAGEGPLTTLYGELTGEPTGYVELVDEAKHLVLRDILGADVNRLTNTFLQVCEAHRRYRDYTRHELHEVLREVLANFPVYRTYVRPGHAVRPEDDRVIAEAVEQARERRPELDPDLFGFLADVLRLRYDGGCETELALRFQQATGPVMAKSVEDTAFYRYNRLACLNEVGGDPGRFGTSVDDFHAESAAAAERWPHGLLATSTHDTKRSEDVRARIALLSEIPDEWASTVRRWTGMNERHKRHGMPDRNAEYLLYQTLVGAHPLTADRAAAYMTKASKEAKARTSWIDPDPAYDEALDAFVGAVIADPEFAADLTAFVSPLVGPGRVNSLTQALLRLTAPGVPDTYQGTEVWDLSLVDPDNRRPVDYDARRILLAQLPELSAEDVLARADDGLPKLLVTTRALHARRAVGGDLGTYTPIAATGAADPHVLAFERGAGLVTVVQRLVLGLERRGGWGDTRVDLPRGGWRNVLTGDDVTGGPVEVEGLLARFPVALLERR